MYVGVGGGVGTRVVRCGVRFGSSVVRCGVSRFDW